MKQMSRGNGFFREVFGSVRKLVAIALTGVFCYLTVQGKVAIDQFLPVFSMVIGYYFGKSTALDVPGNISDNQNKDM